MLLQKTVKGVVSQMEDRGARLGPRHLWGLRLWGLRAETGNGKGETRVRNTFKYGHITTAVPSCREQKSDPAVVHTPPSVTKVEQNCLTLVDEAQCGLWVYEKMDKHSAHSTKRAVEHSVTTSVVSLQRLVVLWWSDCVEPQKWHIKTQPPRPTWPLFLWADGCPAPNYTAGKTGLYIFEFFTTFFYRRDLGFLLEPVICGRNTKLDVS